MYCYCPATQKRFREWLKAKYGTLEALGKAWYRYSYSEWDDVHPPKNFSGYPESLDWLEFRIDNAHRLAKWRVDLVRQHDPKNKVIAHGVAMSLEGLPSATYDEWRSAKEVDVWGFTWVASRRGVGALEAVSRRGPGARRFTWQAVLARRGAGGSAVDAAAGDRPAARGRTHRR